MKTLFLQPQMRIFMHMKMKAIFLLIISFSAISCGDTDNPGNDDSLVITTDDRFVDCVGYTGVEETLEVTTWNIERFPLNENLTPAAVMGTITGSNIDLWALQEISEPDYLRQLEQISDDYDVIVDEDYLFGVNDGLHLAYVYNKNELEIVEVEILNSAQFEFYYFPRKPFLVTFKNLRNNEEFTIINIHLKCCGGEQNRTRRREAAEILESYLNLNYTDQKVILTGDFNTVIHPYMDSDMTIFLDQDDQYHFTDIDIARDSSLPWSYPSYPSHIDHILISTEFYSQLVNTYTMTLNSCDSRYSSFVSDHRPVISIFNN